MEGQMDIFDFMEKPSGSRQLLHECENPAMPCANCVCQNCANNAAELWDRVKPEEVVDICFDCDECRALAGDSRSMEKARAYCDRFQLSEYRAAEIRKLLEVIL